MNTEELKRLAEPLASPNGSDSNASWWDAFHRAANPAAILAMIPLSRSAFWGPMAITIMGGLFVATFLTLLYLPGLYALWFRKTLEESGPEQINTAPQHAGNAQHAFPLAEAAE